MRTGRSRRLAFTWFWADYLSRSASSSPLKISWTGCGWRAWLRRLTATASCASFASESAGSTRPRCDLCVSCSRIWFRTTIAPTPRRLQIQSWPIWKTSGCSARISDLSCRTTSLSRSCSKASRKASTTSSLWRSCAACNPWFLIKWRNHAAMSWVYTWLCKMTKNQYSMTSLTKRKIMMKMLNKSLS